MNLSTVTLSEIVAFIAIFVSLFSYVMQWRRDKNKPILDGATAAQVNTAANIALIEPLTKRIDALEFELNEMRDELKKRDEIIERQNVGIGILLTQIGRARLTPDWKPTAYTTTTTKPVTGFKR